MANLSPASAQAIARLRSYGAPPTTWHSLPVSRRAAVLILLFPDRKGDLRVVLTIRASTLKNYAGQAALPGGKADSHNESPTDIARREAFEEIGLPTDDNKLPPSFKIEHLTELPTALAMTNLGVRPVCAYLSPSSTFNNGKGHVSDVETSMIPRLDAKEVAAVFTAPFRNFLKATDDEGSPEWYKGVWQEWNNTKWRMHNFYVHVIGQNVRKAKRSSSWEPYPVDKPADKVPAKRKREQTPASASTARSEKNAAASSDVAEPQVPSSTNLTATTAAIEHPEGRYRVFGMTARILVDAARIAYDEDPEFECNGQHGDEDMIVRLMRLGRLVDVKKDGEVSLRRVTRI